MTAEKPPESASARRPPIFAIVTIVAAAIVMAILLWRMAKTYSGDPRPQQPMPTSGSFGPPPTGVSTSSTTQ